MADDPTTAHLPVHVERTDDPDTLRWVCHEPRLIGGTLDADASPLGTALAIGALRHVRADHGDLLITADWDRDKIAATTATVIKQLGVDAFGWAQRAWVALDVDTATRVVDDAVAAVAASHGGSITVRSIVDTEDGPIVVVELGGACDGCAGVDDTLTGSALEALKRVDPRVRIEHHSPVPRRALSPVSFLSRATKRG